MRYLDEMTHVLYRFGQLIKSFCSSHRSMAEVPPTPIKSPLSVLPETVYKRRRLLLLDASVLSTEAEIVLVDFKLALDDATIKMLDALKAADIRHDTGRLIATCDLLRQAADVLRDSFMLEARLKDGYLQKDGFLQTKLKLEKSDEPVATQPCSPSYSPCP